MVVRDNDLLLMDEGSGLLSEKPIVRLWLSGTSLRGNEGLAAVVLLSSGEPRGVMTALRVAVYERASCR